MERELIELLREIVSLVTDFRDELHSEHYTIVRARKLIKEYEEKER